MPLRKFRLEADGFSRAANRLNTTPQIDTAPKPEGHAVKIQNAATARNANALRSPPSTPCSISRCQDIAPGAPGGTLPCSTADSVNAPSSIKRNTCASCTRQKCASWPSCGSCNARPSRCDNSGSSSRRSCCTAEATASISGPTAAVSSSIIRWRATPRAARSRLSRSRVSTRKAWERRRPLGPSNQAWSRWLSTATRRLNASSKPLRWSVPNSSEAAARTPACQAARA